MRKVFLLLAIGLLCSCNKNEEDLPVGSYDYDAKQLSGTYVLSKVFWSGTPTDLNNDGISYHDLLENEFATLPGYYEPYNQATVKAVANKEQQAIIVNLQLPYPDFSQKEKQYFVSKLSYLPISIPGASDSKKLSFKTMNFKNDDYFALRGIEKISIEKISPKEIQVRAYCLLYNLETQTPVKNYLHYTYQRMDGQ